MEIATHKIISPSLARIVMTLIIIAVTVAGVFSSKLLLWLGLDQILYRYPLAVIISYLTFLGLIWLWVYFMKAQFREKNTATANSSLGIGAAVSGATILEAQNTINSELSDQNNQKKRGADWGSGNWDFGNLNFGDGGGEGEGVVIFFFIVLVVAIIVVSVYTIAQAPILLDQVVFEILLASGLIRSAKKYSGLEWVGGLLRATIIPFLVVFIATGVFAFVAHNYCPHGNTLSDIFGPACKSSTRVY